MAIAVIGGLITESETETVNKLPILGDIPVLGFFFKHTQTTTLRESLFIFITPRIVRDSDSFAGVLADEEQRRQKAIQAEVERIWGAEESAEKKEK